MKRVWLLKEQMEQKEAKLCARESGCKLNLNVQARSKAKSVKVTKNISNFLIRTESQENHIKIIEI